MRPNKRLLVLFLILLLPLIILNCFLTRAYLEQKQTLLNLHKEIGSLKQIKQESDTERETLRKEIELLHKKTEVNDRILNENDKLRRTIKTMSFREGVSRSGTALRRITPLEDIDFQRELGVWKISYYTPTKEECGSSSGITASSRPVVGAYTCAADTSIWPFGTLFYVEGWGLVEVMDRGGAIKGSNRLDICLVTDRQKAFNLGVGYRKVWLVKRI